MKIVTRLPNLFDQYSVPENRVTNALLQTLVSSEQLLLRFLERFLPHDLWNGFRQVEVHAQTQPQRTGQKAGGSRSVAVPDGWFIFGSGSGEPERLVLLEVKIERGKASGEQLDRHVQQARRRTGCNAILGLLLTPDDKDPLPALPRTSQAWTWVSWRDVHRFLRPFRTNLRPGSAAQNLAHSLAEFLEMNEIVGFAGIDFADGYDVATARSVLKALRAEIAGDVARVYPGLTKSKGTVMDPWDVFAPADAGNFTDSIHLVLGLDQHRVDIRITLPNHCGPGWRRLRALLSSDKEMGHLKKLMSEARQRLPNLALLVTQRHFVARRFDYEDGRFELDLDTTDFARLQDGKTLVKPNPKLFDLFVAALRTCAGNRSINAEFNLNTRFWYKTTPEVRTEEFRHTVVDALAAFRELYDFLTKP